MNLADDDDERARIVAAIRRRPMTRAQQRWVIIAREAMARPSEHERWAIVPAGKRSFKRACRVIAKGHLDFAQIISRRGQLIAVVDHIGHGIQHDPRF